MMRFYCWAAVAAAFWALPAEGNIVVDHSANRTYGSFSDTGIGGPGGTPWQLTADDFSLESPATIRHITWWGGYLLDDIPAEETMRIRIYGARPVDGLPGNILTEQHILNPTRTATGDAFQVRPYSVIVSEYRLEADLPIPASLDEQTCYWLEIAQIGDLNTQFYWRGSDLEQTGRVVLHHQYDDWVHFDDFNMAFQLSTIPEPGSFFMLLCGIGAVGVRARRRGS